jgi:hypothetical protein
MILDEKGTTSYNKLSSQLNLGFMSPLQSCWKWIAKIQENINLFFFN